MTVQDLKLIVLTPTTVENNPDLKYDPTLHYPFRVERDGRYFKVGTNRGGSIPKSCEGSFTTVQEAEKQIRRYYIPVISFKKIRPKIKYKTRGRTTGSPKNHPFGFIKALRTEKMKTARKYGVIK